MEQEITLLIVDDEEEIRRGLRRVIQKEQPDLCFLDSVTNGAEGLKMIREHLPDIVITDINMPEMSGIDMIAKAREEGYNGNFVVLSGYDDFKYAQSAIRYGVDDYLIKPVVIDDLREIIQKLKEKIGQKREQQDDKVRLSQSLKKANRIITEQNFMSEFLRRELSGKSLTEAIQKVDPALMEGAACAVVFYFYRQDIIQDDEVSQISLNVLCGAIRRELAAYHFCMGYDGRNGAVLLLRTDGGQDIRQTMREIADKLFRYYRVRCFVAVGEEVAQFKDINQSYKSAALISTWHIYPQLGRVGDKALTEKKNRLLFGGYPAAGQEHPARQRRSGPLCLPGIYRPADAPRPHPGAGLSLQHVSFSHHRGAYPHRERSGSLSRGRLPGHAAVRHL